MEFGVHGLKVLSVLDFRAKGVHEEVTKRNWTSDQPDSESGQDAWFRFTDQSRMLCSQKDYVLEFLTISLP